MMPLHRPKSAASYLAKIHVMVVDNDPMNTDLLVNVLKYLGFRDVVGVQNVYKAIQAIRDYSIDLIITDWDLQPPEQNDMLNLPPNPLVRSDMASGPRKDGFYFVTHIRTSKYSPNPYVPLIMLTGIGLQNRIERARDCGVNEILLKPLVIESLCERIAMLIDAPRPFVTSQHYKGPCRRTDSRAYWGEVERRKHDVKIIRHVS